MVRSIACSLTSQLSLDLVDFPGGGTHGPLLLEALAQSEARILLERAALVALRLCACVCVYVHIPVGTSTVGTSTQATVGHDWE